MEVEDAGDDKWKDFCVVEESTVRKWMCDIEENTAGEVQEEVFDDVEDESVGVLDPEKVEAARQEEVSYMNKRGLWEVIPTPPGVHLVSVRWVDVIKSDGSTRSRLVARDFRGNDRGRDDLFAATPPLEAFRMVISRAATASDS